MAIVYLHYGRGTQLRTLRTQATLFKGRLESHHQSNPIICGTSYKPMRAVVETPRIISTRPRQRLAAKSQRGFKTYPRLEVAPTPANCCQVPLRSLKARPRP